VALARAGKSGPARAALADFLARYPRSMRAGRAAILLGGLETRAGDREAARARYRAALADPDPAVRQTARTALTRLAGP